MKHWTLAAVCVVGICAGAWGKVAIIPEPLEVTETGGTFAISQGTVIYYLGEKPGDGKAKETGEYLAGLLKEPLGAQPRVEEENINLDSAGVEGITLMEHADTALGDEGYTLDVTPGGIVILANTSAGLFYGVQSLRQMLPAEIEGGKKQFDKLDVPCVKIKDMPRFKWRGLMLDVARHYEDKHEVESFLDLMALHKLNVFHWHLVDDPGWRIEIKKYPKLTEVGAWRPGIDFGFDKSASTHYDSAGKYGGFYTQDDIREVVAYAARLHITVVPEIEMPGHSEAALRAYPEFSSALAGRGGGRNVYDPGNDKTFDFLEDVLAEVMGLFPGEYIHIGGDEVDQGPWTKLPDCQARMKSQGLGNVEELQSYFIRRIDAFVSSKGKHLIGWDEILEGGLAPGATVMSWRGTAGGMAAVKSGHDVVMSPTSNCYFDYDQFRNLPLRRVYQFDPVLKGMTAEMAAHVLGAQGNIWTEHIPNLARVQYMTYPRACAMAELTWSARSRMDFADFLDRLAADEARLKVMGVNYCADAATAGGVPLGTWTAGQMSGTFQEMDWDVSKAITKAGKYDVRMQYTGGADKLDVAWVALVVDGKEVGRDTHDGETGGRDKKNVYTVDLPQWTAGETCEVKAWVRSDGGTDSNGEVWVGLAK